MIPPLCATCYDYVDDSQVVLRKGGWVHAKTDSAYCPGQEDDDTGDYAEPLTSPDRGEPLESRHYVVGFDDDGYEVLGERVTPENYYALLGLLNDDQNEGGAG